MRGVFNRPATIVHNPLYANRISSTSPSPSVDWCMHVRSEAHPEEGNDNHPGGIEKKNHAFPPPLLSTNMSSLEPPGFNWRRKKEEKLSSGNNKKKMFSRMLYKETRVATLHHHRSPLQPSFHGFYFNTPVSTFGSAVHFFTSLLPFSFLATLSFLPTLPLLFFAAPSLAIPWVLAPCPSMLQIGMQAVASIIHPPSLSMSMPTLCSSITRKSRGAIHANHLPSLHTSDSARLSCCG